jgi:hypothetical protein
MDLKGFNAHSGPGIILFAGAVEAANARKIAEADGAAGQVGGGWIGRVGGWIDGGAAHGAFEAGGRVCAVERVE